MCISIRRKTMKIKKTQGAFGKKHPLAAAIICSAMIGGLSNQALAYTFDTGSRDWKVNLDTSIQYLVGMRAESRDKGIANSMGNHQSDYKFDRGDLVTNRLQTILEFQAVYQDRMGVRVSGSAWKDFAYDDDVEGNPNPGYGLAYDDAKYSNYTKKYHIRGAE